jgi:hypothetical protein
MCVKGKASDLGLSTFRPCVKGKASDLGLSAVRPCVKGKASDLGLSTFRPCVKGKASDRGLSAVRPFRLRDLGLEIFPSLTFRPGSVRQSEWRALGT